MKNMVKFRYKERPVFAAAIQSNTYICRIRNRMEDENNGQI
jgi:hypothetical protein